MVLKRERKLSVDEERLISLVRIDAQSFSYDLGIGLKFALFGCV